MQHDLPRLPPGFYPWPGKRKPRGDGPWRIMLRANGGWIDWNTAWATNKINWLHGDKPSGGDVIAVRNEGTV